MIRPKSDPDGAEETHELVNSNGLTARIKTSGSRFEVDVDWGSGQSESWAQNVGTADAARELLDDYLIRLRSAGFHVAGCLPDGRPRAALSPTAALRVAASLRRTDPLRAELIEADLRDDITDVERACETLERTGSRLSQRIEPLDREVAMVGSFAWAFDDDFMSPEVARGETPDPTVAELADVLGQVRALHLQCFGPLSTFLDLLESRGKSQVLTHLLLTPLQPSPMVDVMPPPDLLALFGARDVLAPWLDSPESLSRLEALTLSPAEGPLPSLLDRLAALPALRHLGLLVTKGDVIHSLVRHPLLRRLETLDLWAIDSAAVLFPLLELAPELPQLERVFIPRHFVSGETRRLLTAQWPVLRFVSPDRLEVLGHDLMLIGFPGGSRGG